MLKSSDWAQAIAEKRAKITAILDCIFAEGSNLGREREERWRCVEDAKRLWKKRRCHRKKSNSRVGELLFTDGAIERDFMDAQDASGGTAKRKERSEGRIVLLDKTDFNLSSNKS